MDAGVVAARCAVRGNVWTADVGDRRSVVVGEGTPTSDGFAAGLLRSGAAGAEALVVRVAGEKVAEEWSLAKGRELVADAPAPKALVAGADLYAAYVAHGMVDAGDTGRRVVLKKRGSAAPLASFPERADESLSFDAALSTDAARAALAWDEDASGIMVAVVPLGGDKPGAPHLVSGPTLDVDSPRLAPKAGGGFWAAWMAHRPEEKPDASARPGAALEAPAEERVYTWIELATVGPDGAPQGAPLRITPALGHAASFDVAARATGELDLVVRDETQSREGEGGHVAHFVVRPDGALADPVVLVASGAGRGSVDLVGGLDGAWLAFSDPQDRTLLLPLGPALAPAGSSSVEDGLEGGRLLLATAAGPPARFVAAFPATDGALFREVTCAP
jgi:hypothetical protein